MISIQNAILAVLFASISLTSALPISFDDFAALEERDGLSCYPLDVDQMKKLPGWGKLEQYAKDTYGEGGVNIVTNPSEYSDRPANACVNVAKVQVQWSGKPQCTESTTDINGKATGTSADISFSQKTGSEQSASWTVTRSSEICSSVSFNVGVELPGLVSAGVSLSASTTIKNERSSSFTTATNDMKETTVSYKNDSGKQCHMALKTKTCTASASGKVPVVASGYVWFNYDDKRAPKNDPNGSAHYKYSIPIDSVLSEAERTSFVEFQGPVNGVNKALYDVNCKKMAKAKPKGKGKGKPAPKGQGQAKAKAQARKLQ